MGEVYRAKDTRLDRTVAIKVLPAHLSSDPDLKQRLELEAKAISALQHANICTLYDIGTQGGTEFLVMEYLEGQTLAERLQKGSLPVEQVLKIATEVAQALEKAHQQGIIHRDLKPANIMLTKAGAKLMDFGLAKPKLPIASQAAGAFTPSTPTMNLASLTSAASPVTQKGLIVGTFQYMAPEVLQGAEADARSDLFGFGCVLYEMITGHRAFEGKSQLSVFTAILEKEPELSFKTREFEFFGASFPSGAVGGDLVDVIQDNDGWFAYVADVSGHGVPAGVLMSMTKSAVRMWLASRAHDSALLSDINSVLKPLLTPNMFVTFAYAAWNGDPDLAFSSAGHVPLPHYRASAGRIEQCSVSNLPLGILPAQGFASRRLHFDRGDILAIVSDGFTETFDSADREFGIAGIVEVLQSTADRN